MFLGPLSNFCDSNKKPLQMLGIVKLRALLGSTQASLKFIICETCAASAINTADFYNQYVMAVRPKQKLVEMNNSDCILIVQKPQSGTRLQPSLLDGRTYPKDNSQPTSLFRVAKKSSLPAHSQMLLTVQTARSCTAALQSYTPTLPQEVYRS